MQPALAPHVYAAQVDGDLVFLDARANAYFCLPRDAAAGLRVLIGDGMPPPPASGEILEELRQAGLLLFNDRPRHLAAGDLYHAPGMRARISPFLLWRLLAAAIGAHLDLRLRRPLDWFRKIARRNARARSVPDRDRLLAFARLARDVQPLVPATAGCLASSLFLLHLLQGDGFRARWVFGVRTYPFEAHCWVEHDGTVLNDSLEHVRWYTPIVAF